MVATLDDREGENSQRKWNIKWFSFFSIHGGRKKKKRGSPSILLSKFHPLRNKKRDFEVALGIFQLSHFFFRLPVCLFFFCQNVTSLTWELTCYHLQELVLSSVSFPLPVRAQSTHPVFHFFGPSVCLSTAFSSYSHNIHCVRVHRWTGGRPPPFYCYDLFFFYPFQWTFEMLISTRDKNRRTDNGQGCVQLYPIASDFSFFLSALADNWLECQLFHEPKTRTSKVRVSSEISHLMRVDWARSCCQFETQYQQQQQQNKNEQPTTNFGSFSSASPVYAYGQTGRFSGKTISAGSAFK